MIVCSWLIVFVVKLHVTESMSNVNFLYNPGGAEICAERTVTLSQAMRIGCGGDLSDSQPVEKMQ